MEDKDKKRSELEFKKSSSSIKIRYLFQGQSARSQYWFKLDTNWIEETLRKGSLVSSKGFIKNILKEKKENIELHFLFQ